MGGWERVVVVDERHDAAWSLRLQELRTRQVTLNDA